MKAEDAGMLTQLDNCVAELDSFFAAVFDELHEWRGVVEQTGGRLPPSALDELVAGFAIPALEREDSTLIGAGFIGDESSAEGGLHFAWWLGPLAANPLFSATNEPTRLDIGARGHADYVQDFAALEWYRVPESTSRAHVTGPYVDHLCTCDYILTVTAPVLVAGRMYGVVGCDIFVHRLERAIMPALLAVGADAAVVNGEGRVVVSNSASVAVGAIISVVDGSDEWTSRACASAPFSVVVRHP